MWDLNDLNTPESEAVQAEREIVEDLVRTEAEPPRPTLHDTLQAAAVRQAEHDTAAYVERRDAPAVDTTVRFKRLRNSAWGIIGPSALLREGAEVAVTKKDGTTTTATVSRVIWSGDGKAICSVRRS